MERQSNALGMRGLSWMAMVGAVAENPWSTSARRIVFSVLVAIENSRQTASKYLIGRSPFYPMACFAAIPQSLPKAKADEAQGTKRRNNQRTAFRSSGQDDGMGIQLPGGHAGAVDVE